MVISLIYYSIFLLVIDLFMASSAGSVASSANKRREGGLQLLANIPTPQQVQKGMHLKIKELTKLKAPLKRLLQQSLLL